ncbi:oligopeptide/dipeptide ABC transporter, ATP-binding protein, C-terminal domain-containing protein [Blastococcus sp. DSM 46786]|uniref:ABC transporter ATP-binding protein n=1 Tax=Blastococcus sp. DSM 46786 TaxID=1798227 RepID=UPI0008B23C34|nr:ABC transporter ATP-binding protein [Blastococcus sp. DSM 46786]SEL66195.1 oligopeptide/dipeptide ABC transporter, ATP-binding protein, C-terminal domain-containing protein [Blastococcus sp. DSM 46786]
MNVLEIDGLTVRLEGSVGARPVLSDVSLHVAGGEVVGLVGESGSGKSVTCRTALGAVPRGASVDGAVRTVGEDVFGLPARELRRLRSEKVGFVPQDPRAAVNPLYRVGDYVIEALRAAGVPKAEAPDRATALLESVGIPEPRRALRRWPHEFSGGMLQRVVIAAALAGSPRLLVADEPTTALDVTIQAEVLSLLLDITAERGAGLLLVTHDLELAAAVCDRAYVMYAGRIVESEPAASLFASPKHPYTAGLLRATPSLTGPVERLTAVPGRPLGLDEVLPGCSFAPRCAHARPVCDDGPPPLLEDGAGAVACVRAGELAPELRRRAHEEQAV